MVIVLMNCSVHEEQFISSMRRGQVVKPAQKPAKAGKKVTHTETIIATSE